MTSRPTITHHGAERLRAELAELKKVERPRIIAAIAEARAHGDLRENAEYHAAKEQQGFIEGRIQHLEAELSAARVIDATKVEHRGKVVFGATVTVYDNDSEKETTYQIVGDIEADIRANRIAVSSPVARALIGRAEGDEVTVKAPGGEQYYEIVKVEYV
jgi:transcription elongation factor GreA